MEGSLITEGQKEKTNQQPSPLLDKPWRELMFTLQARTELLKEIKRYETLTYEVAEPKILLIGQTKAGKSSFFNSVNSVFRGYPIFQATSSQKQKNISKYCRNYTVLDAKGGKRMPFTFCDIMGLDSSSEGLGIHTKDILRVINGHIQDNYKTPEDNLLYIQIASPDTIFYVILVHK
ncbi:interferon-induced protein 44-like [Erpetoichthys calabaricus]|uniref:interferon-induced protein 44-like n=1 Tax=Erpetoichthys calabaricus TaxID=27687 RepID=UPI0022340F7A|nr:interferon-induced protein 44-like [Erpetoichthys calabaricus]